MPIAGLSNQWKSFEGLIGRFADGFRESKEFKNRRYILITQLLEKLNDSSKSWIYVGTSLGEMNFSTHDVTTDRDRTQPFAFVNVVQNPGNADEFNYFVKTRTVIGLRPTPLWETVIQSNVDEVVQVLLNAHATADAPVRRDVKSLNRE